MGIRFYILFLKLSFLVIPIFNCLAQKKEVSGKSVDREELLLYFNNKDTVAVKVLRPSVSGSYSFIDKFCWDDFSEKEYFLLKKDSSKNEVIKNLNSLKSTEKDICFSLFLKYIDSKSIAISNQYCTGFDDVSTNENYSLYCTQKDLRFSTLFHVYYKMIFNYKINSKKFYIKGINLKHKKKKPDYFKLIGLYIQHIEKYGLDKPKKLKRLLKRNGYEWEMKLEKYK